MADVINRDAYTQLLRKVNPALGTASGTTPAQAAPAEAKAGKKTQAPLDTRPSAARNKPKPKHARVPKHLRGRGLISEKAMAAMSGPQDAAKARPWQGQKLPWWAAETHGKHDAAASKSANIKKPKHSKFAKRAGHNPPKPEFGGSETREIQQVGVTTSGGSKRFGDLEKIGAGYNPPVVKPPKPKPDK